MKNPYVSNGSVQGGIAVGAAKLPQEISQNQDIARLAKEITALKSQITILEQQLVQKANKNEVTSIVAWDLSDQGRGAANDLKEEIWKQFRNGFDRFFSSNDASFLTWLDKNVNAVIARLKAMNLLPPRI